MIVPSDIQNLIDQKYKTLDDTHTKLSQIWADHIVFSFGWFTSLFLTVVPWIVWFIFRNKDSQTRLLLGGLWAMLVSSWLDYIGVTLGLWKYYNKLVPIMPDYFPWDFSLMPVTIMFFLQFKPKVRPIIKGLIFAAMTAFLAEPLFFWLGYYEYRGWNSIWSFPFFLVIYLISHKLVHSHATKPLF
ncbi:CBO0543 family protein [Virgibacillus sp. 6R]|uniref:CBO0543 family protein n=1 Tax=Metabacillus sp. 22489 TaxID=3453928 RepID=UPI0011A3AD74